MKLDEIKMMAGMMNKQDIKELFDKVGLDEKSNSRLWLRPPVLYCSIAIALKDFDKAFTPAP